MIKPNRVTAESSVDHLRQFMRRGAGAQSAGTAATKPPANDDGLPDAWAPIGELVRRVIDRLPRPAADLEDLP